MIDIVGPANDVRRKGREFARPSGLFDSPDGLANARPVENLAADRLGYQGVVLHSVPLSLGPAFSFSLVSFVFVCLSGGRVNLLPSYELHRGVKTSSGLLFAVSSGSCEVGTPLAVGHVPGPVGCI